MATSAVGGTIASVPYAVRSAIHGVGALLGYSVAPNQAARDQISKWLVKKHAEDNQNFNDITDFFTYHPRTPLGQETLQGVGEGVQKAADIATSPLPEAAREPVQGALSDVLKALPAAGPLEQIAASPAAAVRAIRAATAARGAKAAAAVAKAAEAATPVVAAEHAVTGDKLLAQDNPIPPPNDGKPMDSASQAVQKPKITPKAGESAQAAAQRQGLLPAAPETSAAPEAPAAAPLGQTAAGAGQRGSARIFHPPQEDGPQHAVKATEAEQDARQTTLGELNKLGGSLMTHDRRGAVTGDWYETGNEHETQKLPGAAGQLTRDQIAKENQSLHNATQSVADETGSAARNDVDRDTLEQRGGVVRDAVHSIEDHFNRTANGLYQTARAVMGDRPMASMPRVQAILADTSHDVNPTAASLRRAAQARLQQLWTVGDTRGDIHTAPGSIGAAERFHEFLNEAHHNDSSSLIRKLKNATDLDIAQHAGGQNLFQTARAAIAHREQLLEPDGVNELRRPRDRNRIDHEVDLDKVMDHVTGQDSEHFNHFMNVLRAGAHLSPELAPKMAAAIREIQGHMVARMHTAARGEAGAWKATDFFKAGNRFSTNMTSAFRESPELLQRLQTINRAGNILKMDKSYPGAVAQAAKVGLIPGLTAKAVKGGKILATGAGAHAAGPLGAIIAHVGGSALEHGAEKLTEGARVRAARESLIPRPKEKGSVQIMHEHDPESGEHVVKSPNGQTLGMDHGERDIKADYTETAEGARGGGEGTQRMVQLADTAHARGGNLVSDRSVSPKQAGVYSALQKLGYDVKKDPSAKVNPTTGNWITDDPRKPVFSVGPRRASVTDLGDVREQKQLEGTRQHLMNAVYERARATQARNAEANERGFYKYQPGDRIRNTQSGRVYKVLGHTTVNHLPEDIDALKANPAQFFSKEAKAARAQREPQPGYFVEGPDGSRSLMAEWGSEKLGGPQKLGDKLPGQRGRVRVMNEEPLKNAPPGDRPNGLARGAAAAYMRSIGKEYEPLTEYRNLQPAVAKQVAGAYDSMKHAPNSPKVKAAYDAFKAETLAQYKAMLKTGIKVDLDKDYPYKVPREVHADVRDNNHMSIFPTETGFGAAPKGMAEPHPLLEKAPIKMGGKDATYNDLFRATHDYFGHIAEGNGFRAQGEYNAWRAHRTMYSEAARGAMDSETLGQNSWVNHGPHAEANAGASQLGTVYAEQKAGLLPKGVVKKAEAGVPALGEAAEHLTAAERAQVHGMQESSIDKLLDAFHGSTPTDETAAMALAGKAKKGWYQRSAQAITQMFGPDGTRFAALLAAMSPQTSVEMNLHNALRTFVNWDQAGRPTTPAAIKKVMEDSSLRSENLKPGKSNVMEAWLQNGVRALTSADPEHESFQLSGPKVDSFMRNLRDNVHEVTNDSWNALAMNIDKALFDGRRVLVPGDLYGKVRQKSPAYLGVSAKIRAAAKTLSNITHETWTPREVQETVWSFVKTAFEHSEKTGKSIPELIRNGELTDDLIASTPDFHHLFASGEHRGFLSQSRYAGAAERMAGEPGEPARPAAASGETLAAAQSHLAPHLTSAGNKLQVRMNERLRAKGRPQVESDEAPF
jgi:hypothetical protein